MERRAKTGREVGLRGRKRAGMVNSAQFRPLKGAKNRLGPPWPAFAHIVFSKRGEIRRGDTETQRWVRNYAEKITVLSHRFTTFRILSYTGGPYYRIFSLFIERSLF